MGLGYTTVGTHALSTARCNACYTHPHFFDFFCCTKRMFVCLGVMVKLLFTANELRVGHIFPSFCMTCSLRQTAVKAFGGKPFSPAVVTDNLKGFEPVAFVTQKPN
jgi:hypothetical protein